MDALFTEVIVAIILGVVSGIAGGAGLGHRNYLNSNTRRLLKRIVRQPAKAIVYFIKMNRTIYNKLAYGIASAFASTAVVKFGRRVLVRG